MEPRVWDFDLGVFPEDSGTRREDGLRRQDGGGAVIIHPYRNRSLAIQVARYLQEELARSSPGSRLPSERTLAEQLQVSRTTVRTALKVLQQGAAVSKGAGSEVRKSPRGAAKGRPCIGIVMGAPFLAMSNFGHRVLPEIEHLLDGAGYSAQFLRLPGTGTSGLGR